MIKIARNSKKQTKTTQDKSCFSFNLLVGGDVCVCVCVEKRALSYFQNRVFILSWSLFNGNYLLCSPRGFLFTFPSLYKLYGELS